MTDKPVFEVAFQSEKHPWMFEHRVRNARYFSQIAIAGNPYGPGNALWNGC
jgi:hypothetical protein